MGNFDIVRNRRGREHEWEENLGSRPLFVTPCGDIAPVNNKRGESQTGANLLVSRFLGCLDWDN